MITWTPIAEMPERCKDGREVLLHFPNGGYSFVGNWDSESQCFEYPGLAHQGFMSVQFDIKELTHFSEINPPAEGEGATKP